MTHVTIQIPVKYISHMQRWDKNFLSVYLWQLLHGLSCIKSIWQYWRPLPDSFMLFLSQHIIFWYYNMKKSKTSNHKKCMWNGKYPAGIYLFKVNNRNTRTRCGMCSKLTIKTSERRHWRRSGVFIVNFEHISHLVLVFLLLILNM